MSTFVPPFFSKFGKSVKDLFSKKYETDQTVKFVSKRADGITLEQGVNAQDSFKGFIKAKYVDKKSGEYEAELNTSESSNSKASAKLTKLSLAGSTLLFEVNSKDKDKTFNGSVGKAELEYSQDYVTTNFSVKSDGAAHKVDVAATAGFDGFSVGGALTLNATNAVDVAEVNFGSEFTRKDATVSLYSEKNAEVINVALYYKYTNALLLGGQAKVGLRQLDTNVTAGFDYTLDSRTQIKGKVDLPSAIVAVAVEQKLKDPSVAFALTAAYNAKNIVNGSVRADKVGVAATFGDY